MNIEAVRKFKMSNTQALPNVKEIIGQTVTPEYWQFSEYVDANGVTHTVLAMDFGTVGIYRTETAAFIERFTAYADAFGAEDEKPAISITGKQSKRGNPFVCFDLV